MKKKMALFGIFVVLSLFGGGFDSFFGQIRGNDPVQSGQMLEYHVNVVNHAKYDLDDVHLNMFVYDLGELIVTNTFDVDDTDNAGKFLFWDTDDVAPRDYLVRITLSNDDFREVKYRYITIT